MNIPSNQVLTKTPQGVNATRSGVGLPPKAHAMLKLFDGSMPVAAFKVACLGASISEQDFQSTLQDLVARDHLRVAADAAAAPSSAAERRLLQTLDFTVNDDLPASAPRMRAPAPAPAVATPAPATMPAAVAAEAAAREDKAARLKRETEVRQKLVAELQPRIEEDLRAKLRPQLEQELRPKLIAALRPGIEAELRGALARELTPRVELELKARFARSLAAQKIAEQQVAPEAAPAAAPVMAPAAEDSTRERVLASLSTPLFSVDKDGVCNFMSAAWEQFSGFAAGDALGKPLAEYFVDADRRAVSSLLTGIANGTALRFEQQGALRRKDGEPLWVEIGAAPLTAADGTLSGACGVMREAAELRRALDQAEADGVRLLLLVDQIDTAVILEDAGGNIQQANTALCGLLSLDVASYSLEGMPVAELLESAAQCFIGPEGFLRRVAEMRAAKEDVKGESFVMADGRVVEQDYLAVTAGDNTVGHLWLFREMQRAPARAAG